MVDSSSADVHVENAVVVIFDSCATRDRKIDANVLVQVCSFMHSSRRVLEALRRRGGVRRREDRHDITSLAHG